MDRPWLIRKVLGACRRLVWLTRMMVLRAPPVDSAAPALRGFTFLRVDAGTGDAARALAEEAMQSAGEEAGLVAPRLAHGDEFFGWVADGQVVSFGWVTYHDRFVGPVQLEDALGRVFLYNFCTLSAYRGRGLYPALLLAARWLLGSEKAIEFILDVDVRNTASVRGIEKAGFSAIALLDLVTILNRWECLVRRIDCNDAARSVFRNG